MSAPHRQAHEGGMAAPAVRRGRQIPPPIGPDLFTVPAPAAAGVSEKLAGMQRADENASDRWKAAALRCVQICADTLPDFTADDVWRSLRESGADVVEAERNPKALGAVMLRAARAGMIVTTGRVRNSTNVTNHARPVQVWIRRPA